MEYLFSAVILAGAMAALSAPFIYALATLRGMQAKKMYPILRYIEAMGSNGFS